jgi:hypothetical protein
LFIRNKELIEIKNFEHRLLQTSAGAGDSQTYELAPEQSVSIHLPFLFNETHNLVKFAFRDNLEQPLYGAPLAPDAILLL